jgi:hypothetical protein
MRCAPGLMNCVLADGLIVMCTASDSAVGRKLDAMIGTFEADERDVVACSGWSVTVTRRAALVTDPDEAASVPAAAIGAWAAGMRDQFVGLTGRGIRRFTAVLRQRRSSWRPRGQARPSGLMAGSGRAAVAELPPWPSAALSG